MPRLQPIHHALRVFALGGLVACGNVSREAPADLVVYGRIWTGDSAAPWASALAVSGDTVRAVGDSASIAPLVGTATRVLANDASMLAPGYKADLVLLDQDLMRIAPEAIERVAVRATVVGGRVVYQAT